MEQCREIAADVVSHMEKTGPQSGHLLGIALKKHTNSGKKDNATPLFDWGKYYEKNGRIMIPISVQVHHSFVDGMHVGQFVDRLQMYFYLTD